MKEWLGLRYKDFHEKYITGVCRDCLNQNTGLKLMSDDCAHDWRCCECPQCGNVRHPIIALKTLGQLQVWFYKDKNK